MIKLNRWLGSFRAGFLIRSDGLSLVSFVYGVISWLCKCLCISEKTARWGRAGVCCWLGTSGQMGVDRSNSCGVPHLCFFPWTTAACLHLIPCICWWFVSSSHNWRHCRVGKSKSRAVSGWSCVSRCPQRKKQLGVLWLRTGLHPGTFNEVWRY